MKLKKRFLINIALAFLVSSSIVAFSSLGFLKRLQLDGIDILFRLRGASPYNPNIVIIQVDDENISKVGRWPWNREWHAVLVKALKDFGAKSIYFDILFTEPSREQDDKVFEEAIAYAGNVYLPFAFQEHDMRISNALFPINEFSEYSAGTGAINIFPDSDGVLRKIPLFFKEKGKIYPHVALQVAMDYSGLKIKETSPETLVLSGEEGRDIVVPLVGKNEMIMNWYGKWNSTFKHYSFLDILLAYNDVVKKGQTPVDIMSIKDSICLVGITAIGLYDIKPSPMEAAYPGIGTMATAVSNILDRRFLSTSPFWINWLLIYILSLVPFFFISGERPLREIISVAIAGVCFFSAVFLLFRKNIYVDFTMPLVSMFTSYVSVASFHFVRASVEKKHFLKLAVTDELTGLSNIRHFMQQLKVECVRARGRPNSHFCVIMSDVDHFKEFNDTYGHKVGDLVLKEVANVLKASVRASDAVARYGGEEWVILLRNTSLDIGIAVAEKMRRNVEEHAIVGKTDVYKATISLGVASFQVSDNEDSLVKRADDALYEAKHAGRNCVKTREHQNTDNEAE